MADYRAKEALRIGDKRFSDKRSIDSLWQEIALNFYPERADFTTRREDGEEFADHLFSSYPVLARRELGNMLAEFLRPEKWFSIHVDDDELDIGFAERKFMEFLTSIQWRAMTDPVASLVTAGHQADHDFATFGNAVIRPSLNTTGDALLFRTYHLRDTAWSENAEGRVDCLHRNWSPTARQLTRLFGGSVSSEVKRAMDKDPDKTFDCRHVTLPARMYDYKSKGGKTYPYVSLYVERESETVLEEIGQNFFDYVVPRWQTVSGSVYGTSMATSTLLPDGRTLQVVMRTLREAAEKYVDPPMVAISDAIRGDIALYAGGVTTADMEYDERLGEVLRPITQNSGGMPIGFEIANSLKQDIRSGWFLDKIQLPENTKGMTATEVRRRVQEHIRALAPLTRPIQTQYNNPLCEICFQILMSHGAFPMEDMPDTLSERELKFKFRSPLDELAEQSDADVYVDVRDRILAPAAQFDPSILEVADLAEATRDAMRASGWKANWFKPREALDERRAQQAEEMEARKAAEEAAVVAQVAEKGGKGLGAVVTAGAKDAEVAAKNAQTVPA